MHNYDVVIIDSGINQNISSEFQGICIGNLGDNYIYSDLINDELGHGTIINTIINKRIPHNRIFNIKICGSVDCSDENMLIAALRYVNEHINCRFINISLGVQVTNNDDELYSICKQLCSKGVIIVSAFDNAGCMSYPAAFDCVIGVDNSNNLKNISEFDYVENSPINVLAKGNIQRLNLEDGRVVFVGGSSVSCAHITSLLASSNEHINCLNDALFFLKKESRIIYESNHIHGSIKNVPFHISTAVVFPFSKESQAFLRFSNMLPFKIKAYYDIRQSGKVGRKLSTYYENTYNDDTIKNIDNVDFSGVDAIILGHLDELNNMTTMNYKSMLIKKAIKEKVNIYSFDSLQSYSKILDLTDVKYYYPIVDKDKLPNNTFGKLYKISKPVVGIFGTSSCQGKFSLQLDIANELKNIGYNVGTIGTEPHSPLFDFDVVFPMGYNSTVYLDYNEIVQYLNYEMNNLCLKGKELILTSSQAQSIPYYCNNLLEFPSIQYFFAVGTNPDAIILCVNYFDELSYIKNTVYALSGLTDAKVIAFVMYPMTYASEWGGVGTSKRMITKDEFNQKARVLENMFKIPTYFLGDKKDLKNLCKNIIEFF